MKLGNELPIRVKDNEVDQYAKRGYKFCPKSEWKTLVRDTNKKKVTEQEPAVESLSKK